MQARGGVLDASHFIDTHKIGRLQILVAVFGALVLFVDGFDTQVIGYITPQIAREWHIPRNLLGPIFSSGLTGLLVGYLLVAPLSARVGHKLIMIGSCLAFGALTFLTSSASNVWVLMIFRFVTGIGLGGAIPSAVALTGEYCPQSWRSSFITFIYAGISLGQLSAGLVSSALLARFGWPSVLWVGGTLPILLAVAIWLAAPESLEYLINKRGDHVAALNILRRIDPALSVSGELRLIANEHGARESSIRDLFQSGRAFGTAAIWLSIGMNLMVNFFIQQWMTQIFIDAGLKQETAIITTSISMAGGIAAAFAVGPLMDRLGPYRIMPMLFVGAALFVSLIGVVVALPLPFLLATNFCQGFCTSGIQKAGNALCVYFYPTALRSTGLGWTLGVGRIGAIAGPLAAGILLGFGWSAAELFYACGIASLIGALAMFLMGRVYSRGLPLYLASRARR